MQLLQQRLYDLILVTDLSQEVLSFVWRCPRFTTLYDARVPSGCATLASTSSIRKVAFHLQAFAMCTRSSFALTWHPCSRALWRHRWSSPFYHIVIITVIVTVATSAAALGCRWPWSLWSTSSSICCGARGRWLRYDWRACKTRLSRCRRCCSDWHNRALAYLRTLLLLLLLLWRCDSWRRSRGDSGDRRSRSMSHTL